MSTAISQYRTPEAAAAFGAAAAASSGDGLAAMFSVGIGGIVLGILAVLGVASFALTAVSAIAFGAALMLSAQSVRRLYAMQAELRRSSVSSSSVREFLAGEMAGGSAGIRFLSGVAAVVLGIIAVSGVHNVVLTLVSLLVVGVTNIISGSTLSGMVLSFMRPEPQSSSTVTR